MGRPGGSALGGILQELRTDLENYYGSVNELKARLRRDLLPKPAALEWYDLTKLTRLPIVSGGLNDQPHIWLMQIELIESIKAMFEALAPE